MDIHEALKKSGLKFETSIIEFRKCNDVSIFLRKKMKAEKKALKFKLSFKKLCGRVKRIITFSSYPNNNGFDSHSRNQ